MQRYKLFGVLGSPYVAKLRAIFRYRHIPFDYIPASFDWAPGFELIRPELNKVQPRIVPVVKYPDDGTYRVDSTAIAIDLERRHPGDRSIVPENRGLAFLSHLLEDMGDEWVLKVAFQYRWGNEEDRNYSNRLIMAELLGGGVPQQTINRAAQLFRDRQISRMPLVGCTPENSKAIESTYALLLDAFTKVREDLPFLFGTRPCLGDFGLFGALFTCRNDPTPGRIMRERSPAMLDWIQSLDEASGVDGRWIAEGEPLSEGVLDLLRLAGAAYLPFLEANMAAYERGSDVVELEIFGHTYRQAPFRYQVKCLRWLRDQFSQLDKGAKRPIQQALEAAGCLRLLQS